MARIMPNLRFSHKLASGAPAVGYVLRFYAAGTSTPLAAYSDQAQSSSFTSLATDANGEAIFWLAEAAAYKITFETDLGVVLWTADQVQAASIPLISSLGAHLLFSPDNTYDIGASAATRPRDIFVGRNVSIVNANVALYHEATDGTRILRMLNQAGVPQIGTISNDPLEFITNATTRWTLSAAGNLSSAAGNLSVGGTSTLTGNVTESANNIRQTANGGQWILGQVSEEITLNTGAAATDSVANLLPANAVIEAIAWRVTEAITTAVSYSIGDATQAARFVSANAGVALNSTGVGLLQHNVANASNDLGPVQTAAAKVRVTCNAAPGAGKIRLTVYYRSFVAPTS